MRYSPYALAQTTHHVSAPFSPSSPFHTSNKQALFLFIPITRGLARLICAPCALCLISCVETVGVVQYTGVLDCFIRMPQIEGMSSLYKGFVPIAARKVLWTVAYFLTYEQALKAIRGSYS